MGGSPRSGKETLQVEKLGKAGTVAPFSPPSSQQSSDGASITPISQTGKLLAVTSLHLRSYP